jgi:predicted transcriptional regulator
MSQWEENTAKELQVLKEKQENTTKQVEVLIEKQENTSKQVMEMNKTILDYMLQEKLETKYKEGSATSSELPAYAMKK